MFWLEFKRVTKILFNPNKFDFRSFQYVHIHSIQISWKKSTHIQTVVWFCIHHNQYNKFLFEEVVAFSLSSVTAAAVRHRHQCVMETECHLNRICICTIFGAIIFNSMHIYMFHYFKVKNLMCLKTVLFKHTIHTAKMHIFAQNFHSLNSKSTLNTIM